MDNKTSLKDIIYNAIMEDILSLNYLPGEILTEKAMIEKYNYSKSPVREALQALCGDKVLCSIPRCGYQVVRITMEDIQEMLQFRYILEGGIIRSRYSQLTKSQLSRLEELDKKCGQQADDIWLHWSANMEFHLKLVAFCGNSYAAEELRRCMSHLRRGYVQLCWGKWERDYPPFDTRNHSRILDCIREKDEEGIAQSLFDDLNDFAGMGVRLLP